MIYTITLNPALDKTSIVDHLAINQISRILETTEEAGGKGFNVSRALSRSGVPNKAIGFIGGDTGEKLIEGLQTDGIDFIPVSVSGDTRVNQVFITVSSQSIKINAQGPKIRQEEYQSLTELVSELAQADDVWVLSGSLPMNVPSNVYADLTGIIHSKQGKVFLDSSGAAFQKGLNVQPDWIKPNLAEAQAVFSGGLTEMDLLEQLQQLGVDGTILTMGSKGLMYANSAIRLKVVVPQIENENVVGAGDATVAGFIYGYANGFEPVECAKWAGAFGVAAAHASGNCFKHFDEVRQFYQQLEVEIL